MIGGFTKRLFYFFFMTASASPDDDLYKINSLHTAKTREVIGTKIIEIAPAQSPLAHAHLARPVSRRPHRYESETLLAEDASPFSDFFNQTCG
jgi:hypothetical protein